MIKRYHGNFSRLIKSGKIFTKYLVRGRDAIRISDNSYHIIGMETLLIFSQKAKVLKHRGYTIIKDGGRYHIFK